MVLFGSSLVLPASELEGVSEELFEELGGGIAKGGEVGVVLEGSLMVALARFETARARTGRGVAGGEAPGVEQGVWAAVWIGVWTGERSRSWSWWTWFEGIGLKR